MSAVPLLSPDQRDYLYDGTTDGTHNYALGQLTRNVYSFDPNWENFNTLFTLPTPIGGGFWLGITYDSSDNSLWVSTHNNQYGNYISHYTLGGVLLGSFFVDASDGFWIATGLAFDAADQTLWLVRDATPLSGFSVRIDQYSRQGVFLGSMTAPELQNFDSVGAEFPVSDIRNVVWTNKVLASDSGNTLMKTGTHPTWDAGASSTKAISGDGYAEFTATANNVYWMAGLSSGDSNASYQDIDYAVYAWGGGHSYAIDDTGQHWLGTYTTGTTFRVEVQGNNLLYKRDGVVMYQRAFSPSGPLLLDSSIYTPGAVISNAVLSGALVDTRDIQNVVWTNKVLASDAGNTLTKTGTSPKWDAGASSTKAIAPGDGYAEFTVTANNVYWMAGLSSGDSNASYQDIDYAVYAWGGGHSYALDDTGQHWLGIYTIGTTFRIEIQGSNLLYKRDGVVMYQRPFIPSGPLVLDSSIYTPGAQIGNAIITGNLVEVRTIQNVVWTNKVLTSDAGNTLTKTGAYPTWDAGASSTQAIASGDGYAEFTATADGVYWMAGLSNGDSDTSYQDIDYAVYAWGGGHAYALDDTGQHWLGIYTAGTTFRIEIQGSNLLYKRDGVVMYQRPFTPGGPLVLDTSIYTPGAQVGSAIIAGNLN